MSNDLVTLTDEQEQLRRVAGSNPAFTDEPGLAVALSRSGATQEQIRAVGGYLQASQLAVQVANARESGAQLDFNDNQRAVMAAANIQFNDIDKQANQQQQQADQPTHRGFLGTVSNIVNNTTQLPVIKQALHGLNRAADITNTLYRGGGEAFANPAGFANDFGSDLAERTRGMEQRGYNPGSLISQFAFMSRGQQVYHNMDDLRREFSPERVNYAQQYLVDPHDFVAPNLSDDELAKRQALLADPKFQTLVQQVDAKHISPGRDIAGAVFKPGQGQVPIGGFFTRNVKIDPYNALSGGIDAVWSFAADPTIILGKARAGVKAARYGIQDLSDTGRVESLMRNNTAVRNGWQSFLSDAKTMRSGNDADAAAAFARVQARTPELTPLLDEVNGGGIRNGVPIENYDDLVKHVVGHTALARMRNGLAASETPLMPGAVPRIGFRAIRANLAGKLAEHGINTLDLTKVKNADNLVSNEVDGVNALGADQTGLDNAVLKSDDASAVGEAALKWRRSVKGRLSTLVQRVTTLLPEHNTIDLTNASGAEDIKRFAALFMPRSHANLLGARFATATVGERRTIAESVYKQAVHAAGIPASTSGRNWLRAQEALRAVYDNSSYDQSGKDRDRIAGAAGEPERRAALYEGQTSTDYWLPNFADMRRVAAKVSVYDFTLKSALESQFMDTALGALRTSWLVSPASAIRNGMENVISAHFRGASTDEIARSRAALSSVLARRSVDKAMQVAKQEVSDEFEKETGTLRGIWQGAIMSNIKRAEAHIGRGIANDELIKRAQELVDDQMGGDLKELMALSGLATRGDVRSVEDMTGALQAGWRVRAMGFKNAGYQLDGADGNGGAKYWAQQLGIRFSGSEGQHVLKAALDGSPDSKQTLVDFLLSDQYKTARAKLERFGTLRDGTKVGSEDVADPMVQRAAQELAEDQVEDMKALVTGRNGKVHPELVKKLQAGYTPKIDFLQGLGPDARPEQVIQPKWVPDLTKGAVARNVVQALGDASYHYAVARPLAWMSSLPIYHANYVKAYRRVEQMLGPDIGEAHIRDVARQHAMDLTVQMIDNPAVRSQMALITRNVFNFWRAQEDFMRRWGRNLKENPAALREAQLVIEGGMHNGLVHQDDQGNLVFSYPGSGAAIQAIGKALGVFGLGDGVSLGTVPNMQTKLQFLNAGLDRPFLPTTSPVASIPLRLLKHFTHDQTALIQGVQIGEGQVGAGRSWWAQFIPSPVYRFMAGQSADEQEGQLASAAKNAAQNLYAAGLAPPDNATPDEQDRFQKRVLIGVRNHLTARAMLGLFLPGAPGAPTEETDASRGTKLEDAAFNTTSLKQEFSQWVNQYGYQRALALWTKVHPDDLIYTVATTQGAGGTGGFLAPTDNVLGWMKDNPDLVKNYPALAAYFAPDGPGDFSNDAWRAELELGLRQHKDLNTFYRDVVVKNAESIYYKSRDARDKAVAAAMSQGDNEKAQAIKSAFSTWIDGFKKANPLLLEKWQESDQNKTRLANLIQEVHNLANDPALTAKIDPHRDLARLAQAYENKLAYDNTHDARSADERAKQDRVNTAYLEYVGSVLQRSPQLIPLYQGVFDRVE